MARREWLGISRADLAKRLGTNYLRVWRLETGRTPIRVDDLPAIARELGITQAELLA